MLDSFSKSKSPSLSLAVDRSRRSVGAMCCVRAPVLRTGGTGASLDGARVTPADERQASSAEREAKGAVRRHIEIRQLTPERQRPHSPRKLRICPVGRGIDGGSRRGPPSPQRVRLLDAGIQAVRSRNTDNALVRCLAAARRDSATRAFGKPSLRRGRNTGRHKSSTISAPRLGRPISCSEIHCDEASSSSDKRTQCGSSPAGPSCGRFRRLRRHCLTA